MQNNNTVRVRIVKCSDDLGYKELIDQVIMVTDRQDTYSDYYHMVKKDSTGTRLFILKSDCIVLTKPEKIKLLIQSKGKRRRNTQRRI